MRSGPARPLGTKQNGAFFIFPLHLDAALGNLGAIDATGALPRGQPASKRASTPQGTEAIVPRDEISQPRTFGPGQNEPADFVPADLIRRDGFIAPDNQPPAPKKETARKLRRRALRCLGWAPSSRTNW